MIKQETEKKDKFAYEILSLHNFLNFKIYNSIKFYNTRYRINK